MLRSHREIKAADDVLVQLRDGTPAVVRPMRPVPREAIEEAYAELSEKSQFHRFLSATPHLTEDMFRRLIDEVDGVDHVALFLVLLPDEGPESILGVARIVRYDEDRTSADVAVTVRENWHGRGVASVLLAELLRARPIGVTRIRTHVAVDNPASLAMLQRLGETRITDGDIVWEVEVDLPPV